MKLRVSTRVSWFLSILLELNQQRANLSIVLFILDKSIRDISELMAIAAI
jgi:hypothetical protein